MQQNSPSFSHELIRRLYRLAHPLLSKQHLQRSIILHNLYPHQLLTLKSLLAYLQEQHGFLDPHTFLEGDIKPGLLLTFDDGFLSNYFVAEILDELSIKAIFFVPTDFIGLTDPHAISSFCLNNLMLSKASIYSDISLYRPMSWSQLKDLNSRGHIIGSHTCSHASVSSISDAQLMHELFHSYSAISNHLNNDTKLFAFPFGHHQSLCKISKSPYTHHFTGLRGPLSSASKYPARDSIDLTFTYDLIEAFLYGIADIRYSRYLHHLNLDK